MRKIGRYLVGLSVCQLLAACGGGDSEGSTVATDGNLMQTVEVEPGDDCEAGGFAIQRGVDADADGELVDDEIESEQFICNGADGADGVDGENGADGTDGEDGMPGADGTDGANGADG